MAVVITTSLNDKIHEDCKKRGWSWSELLELGYETRLNKGKENIRITQIDNSIEIVEQRLQKWISKAYEMQRQIALLEQLLGVDLDELIKGENNETIEPI